MKILLFYELNAVIMIHSANERMGCVNYSPTQEEILLRLIKGQL